MNVVAVGIDTAIKNCGIAVVKYRLNPQVEEFLNSNSAEIKAGWSVFDKSRVMRAEVFRPESSNYFSPVFLEEHQKYISSLLKFEGDLELKEGDKIIVGLESPAFGMNSQISIGMVSGVYCLTLYKKNIPAVWMSPPKHKHFLTGKGSCSKDDTIQSVQKILDFSKFLEPGKKLSHDIADAASIGYCAAHTHFLYYTSQKLDSGKFLEIRSKLYSPDRFTQIIGEKGSASEKNNIVPII